MAKKTYQVRQGFIFSMIDANGKDRTYQEGDTLDLDIAPGETTPHQLELASEKERAKAAEAEAAELAAAAAAGPSA